MKDNIEENLTLKFSIFLTLLGGWFYLTKLLFSFIPVIDDYILVILLFCASYIIFYPLFQLMVMLVYISLYQVEEKKQDLLKKKYLEKAKLFWKYWSVLLLFIPFFVFLKVITESLFAFIIFCFVGAYLFWHYICKHFWKGTELKTFFLWFVLYFIAYLFFIAIIYEAIN